MGKSSCPATWDMHASWKNCTVRASDRQGVGLWGMAGRRSRSCANNVTLSRNDLKVQIYAGMARITSRKLFSGETRSK